MAKKMRSNKTHFGIKVGFFGINGNCWSLLVAFLQYVGSTLALSPLAVISYAGDRRLTARKYELISVFGDTGKIKNKESSFAKEKKMVISIKSPKT